MAEQANNPQLSETCWSDGGSVQLINNQPNPRELEVIKGKNSHIANVKLTVKECLLAGS